VVDVEKRMKAPSYEELAMNRVRRGVDNTDAIVFALLAIADAIKSVNKESEDGPEQSTDSD
jgi:hypothetical protein